MSIFSSLAAIAAPIVGGIFGGPAGAAIGTAIGGALAPAAPPPQAPRAAPRPGQIVPFQQASLPALPSALPIRSMRPPLLPVFPGQAPAAFGAGGACPSGFHLDKRTRSRCVRNRRMNPLNGRAASRAIRRIKGARKMLQKIERSLPRSKARTTPAHGHRVSVKAT